MTPEEAFTGRRPDVEHIRIFGCATFSHVPSERRTKLDPTAQQGILVGYSEVSKAYRIYIPPLRKVVVSRDVRFEEDRAFARSLESRVEQLRMMQRYLRLQFQREHSLRLVRYTSSQG